MFSIFESTQAVFMDFGAREANCQHNQHRQIILNSDKTFSIEATGMIKN
jgi:hypothetical protein